MLLKTDWNKYLHTIRKQEIDIISSYFGNKGFNFGLEIGAGDGYQTQFLSERCSRFISSDLNFGRIKEKNKNPKIEFIQCDADNLENKFKPGQFDLVFSSNVLEHLSKPDNFLKENAKILSLDGFAVHIVPNRWMKFFYIVLFYPNVLVLVIDRIAGLFKGEKVFRGENISSENNINSVSEKPRGRFRKIFIPQPHGNYRGHYQEFKKWGKNEWRKIFTNNGLIIEKEFMGPMFSGYGFGCDSLRKILESLGIGSEYIYILRKQV